MRKPALRVGVEVQQKHVNPNQKLLPTMSKPALRVEVERETGLEPATLSLEG